MAKRGVSLNPGYKSGSHWAICDYCGFQFRAEELKEDWRGLWACDEDFERRHPQEFIRIREEKIAADQPLRLEDTSNTTGVVFQNVSPRNVAEMTYDDVSYDLNATTGASGHLTVNFSPDGTAMYVLPSGTNQTIYQFTLSTPWDLSTASDSGKTFTPGGTHASFRFRYNGLELYIMDNAEIIRKHTVSVAWDISTASASVAEFDVGAVTVPETVSARDFCFDGDGTRLYYIDSTGPVDNVYLLNLSTAWDITTLSWSNTQAINTTLGVNPSGLFYTPDEFYSIWLTESGADTIVEYDFPDLDDITSISPTGNTRTLQTEPPTITSLQGVFIADDKLYAYGLTVVLQFTLPDRPGRPIDTIPTGTFDNTL